MNPPGARFVCYVDELGFYLGDVKQVAAFLNLDVDDILASSPWTTRADADGALALITAPRVQAIWGALRTLRIRHRINGGPPMIDQTIFLFMPCGHGAHWVAFDDIPWQSTPCPCGDPKHWLIRYVPVNAPTPDEGSEV